MKIVHVPAQQVTAEKKKNKKDLRMMQAPGLPEGRYERQRFKIK